MKPDCDRGTACGYSCISLTRQTDKTSYCKLIAVGKARQKQAKSNAKLACYEKHHIWPQSFSLVAGNKADSRSSNLVLLTPTEHYEAHRLLAAIWKGRGIRGDKACYAWWRMCHHKDGSFATAEEYEEAKANASAMASKALSALWQAAQQDKHPWQAASYKQAQSNRMKLAWLDKQQRRAGLS